MESRVTEVADGVHQLSTFVGAPVGFNQYAQEYEPIDGSGRVLTNEMASHNARPATGCSA